MDFEQNKWQVILSGLGIFLLGVAILAAKASFSPQNDSSVEILPSKEANQPKKIFIHIAGAVQNPGIYQLESGSRVNDILVMAGGLSAKADRDWFNKNINLAQKLADGIKLYIPFQGEKKQGQVAGKQISSLTGKININIASALELASLPGIGPSFSQRIIAFRQTHGPFAKIEDLKKVSGVGDKLFQQIKEKITVF